MRWLSSATSRALFYIAVSLIVVVVIGTYLGAKLPSSYNVSVPASGIGAAVLVVMPTSVKGVATVTVRGASEVLYLSLGTNPIGLLPEVRGLGLRIVYSAVKTDLRAGVMYDVAGLQGNPIFVEQAFQGVVKSATQSAGAYKITSSVTPQSYLVVVAVPGTSPYINMTADFRVTGYGRLGDWDAVGLAVALIVAAIVYDVARGSSL